MQKTLSTLIFGLCVGLAPVVQAQGVSGSYLAGRQASFLGDFDAAAKYYSESLMHDPTKAELLERSALAFMSLGRIADALPHAERLEADGHRSQIAQMVILANLGAESRYEEILARLDADRGVGPLVDGLIKAWSLLGEGNMTAALVEFDTAGEMRGLERFAAYHKALALASVGDFEGADRILSSEEIGAVAMTRRGVMAHAETLSQLDRNADALALLERSFGTNVDPGIAEMRDRLTAGETLGFSYIRSARDGLAEVFFSLAGALSQDADAEFLLTYARLVEHLRPGHTDAVLLVAELLQDLQQHDLAVMQYRKVAPEDPAFHAAELGRVGALRAIGRDEAAIEVLNGLTRTHGDLSIVYATLGDTLRRMDRFAEAAEAYTIAIDLQDDLTQRDWFLFYARGISHERQDMWDKAEADFRKSLELNPEQPQVLNYLGYSLVEKQIKLDEALSMIERAVAAQPDSGYIVDSLGWVLFRLGRYDEAVGHMERAAELMPVDPVVNDHLGDVYWAVGREMEARFQWRRALSFIDYGTAAEDVDPDRIRRKLEVGLDQVLSEEGAPPLQLANGSN